MTWTAAADAVMPGCARAAAACLPTADTGTGRFAIAATALAWRGPVQRAVCGSGPPGCRHHEVRADLATLGWPSDPGRDVL